MKLFLGWADQINRLNLNRNCDGIPFALMAVFVVLLAAMPWRRPHPNHQFMLEFLRLLEEDEQTRSCDSPLTHPQSTKLTATRQVSSIPSSEMNDSGKTRRS